MRSGGDSTKILNISKNLEDVTIKKNFSNIHTLWFNENFEKVKSIQNFKRILNDYISALND